MRAPAVQTDWRTWLDASLFPFKIFTVVAGLWLLGWHAQLPANNGSSWGDPLVESFRSALAAHDFYTFVYFVAWGYFLSTIVLTMGGITQAVTRSWRAATWSISFAGAALIIGIGIWYYVHSYGHFGNPLPDEVIG